MNTPFESIPQVENQEHNCTKLLFAKIKKSVDRVEFAKDKVLGSNPADLVFCTNVK